MSIDDRNVFYENEPNDRPRPQPTPMGRGRSRRRSNWLGTFVAILLLVILTCGVVYITFFADVHVQRTGNGLLLYFGTRQAQPAETHTVSQSETPAQAETPEADTSSALAAQPAEDPPSVEIESSPAAPATPASEDEADGALSLQEIYKKCIGSVVSITASAQSGKSSGTGIVLSADGYLITNHHVIENAQVIAVQTSDDRQFQASIIGSDEASDLAVLKVDATDLQPAEFGDSAGAAAGDTVYVFSHPFGAAFDNATMTDGSIAAVQSGVRIGTETLNVFQTDAAPDSGSAGGPLVNEAGQVIGICIDHVGSYVSYQTVPELGFAIPISETKTILDDLIVNGYVSGRVSLGLTVSEIPETYRRFWGLPSGVVIESVTPGSNAYYAGLHAGDVICQLGDSAVTNLNDYRSILSACHVGEELRVYIYRDGRQYYTDVTLTGKGESPSEIATEQMQNETE